MADPFVAEIRIFPFNFAPKGWAWCDGQLLPLSQNTALFSLLGTTYGGDGKSNFALPDLQGRAPMHPGQGPGLSLHDLGETGGSETVTLLESEIPAHAHALRAARRTRQCARSRRPSSCRPGTGKPYSTGRWASPDGARGAGARGRRPAAQQPAAVPDVLLRDRAAGRVPAARDMTDSTLVGRPLTLRPATADDEPFLGRVYAGTRAAELAAVSWTEEEKAAFVQMQFAAQAQYYREHYPDTSFDVILLDASRSGGSTSPAGPTRSASSTSRCCPSSATAASGRRCCRQLQAEAPAAGKPLRIHVERFNPALRLYERLGFRQIEDHGVYLFLEWEAWRAVARTSAKAEPAAP